MLFGDRRLSASAVKEVRGDTPIYYSSISFLEIALKQRSAQFDFSIDDAWDEILPRALEQAEVVRIDVEASDCRATEALPLHHRDPFDRLLIAQATRRNLGILSKDKTLDLYRILRKW